MSKPDYAQPVQQFQNCEDRVVNFANRYALFVEPDVLQYTQNRINELNLSFSPAETTIIAALNTPTKLQNFIDSEISYNNDHATPDSEETAHPPRVVLQKGVGHCFEGATFAHTIMYIHNHNPAVVLLEATRDTHHNIVVFQDPITGRYGAVGQSSHSGLKGKPADYSTLQELVQQYQPYYYSDHTSDPTDYSLVGYSEPIDLADKYGTSWMDTAEPLWDIYFTYTGDTVPFRRLYDTSGETHLYPMVAALKNNWIGIDSDGKARAYLENLPETAQSLWKLFNRINGDDFSLKDARAKFLHETLLDVYNFTPLDLFGALAELQQFVDRGYRLNEIVTNGKPQSL